MSFAMDLLKNVTFFNKKWCPNTKKKHIKMGSVPIWPKSVKSVITLKLKLNLFWGWSKIGWAWEFIAKMKCMLIFHYTSGIFGQKVCKTISHNQKNKNHKFSTVFIAFLKKWKNASKKIMAPALEICVKVKIMKKSMLISLGRYGKKWHNAI